MYKNIEIRPDEMPPAWEEADQCIHVKKGDSILEILQDYGYLNDISCSGKGICGRCAVSYLKNAPLPVPADRVHLSTEQLREGVRLSCGRKLTGPIFLKVPVKEDGIKVLFSRAETTDQNTLIQENTQFVVLVDLGTTTIAMELRDRMSGKVYAQYAVLNPQRRYGADVLSRIEQACKNPDLFHKMKRAVEQVILAGIETFEKKLKSVFANRIDLPVYVAGNTTMLHLFAGYPVTNLGTYPFTPWSLEEAQVEIGEEYKISCVILPGISTFVGADILADLWVLENRQAEKRQTREEETDRCELLVDLGTNCEMALRFQGKLYVTATAAGPAFEGCASQSVFGADLIREIADLLTTEKMDHTGLLKEDYFEQGIISHGIHITEREIRAIQLAKAAVAAGIQILLQEAKVPSKMPLTIYLAGGFGHFLDGESAKQIGLFPKERECRIISVKNMVLEGIFHYQKGNIPGKEVDNKNNMQEIRQKTTVINLAEHPAFQTIYLENIDYGSF